MSNHTEEARKLQKKVNSMEILGANANFTGKNKYAIVMQGNLYYFPVLSGNEEAFLDNFKEGGKYFEIADGRLPNLLTNKTLTTNQQLNIIEKGVEPAISNYDYLQQEINIAEENGDVDRKNELQETLINNYTNLNTKYNASEGLNIPNDLINTGGGEETTVDNQERLVGFGSATPKGVIIEVDNEGRTILKSDKNPVPDHFPIFDYALKYDSDGKPKEVVHNPATFYMKGMK
tara:strand:- start:6527 stop:7225 length:699 start_codon:yes stop_codon:yes gene_type:complete